MKFSSYPAMADALGMTRLGRLTDATALIAATLSAGLPSGPLGQTGASHAPIPLKPFRPLLSSALADIASESTSPASSPFVTSESRFLEQSFRNGGKTLHYRLYVPANAGAGMPLVVMLHGCTQSAEDFARGTGMNALADTLGFFVAYPIQTSAANAQKCWNWFQPSDQVRGRGEPGLIAGLTRQIIAERACDEARIYIAGLSAGGAAAANMASIYPDLYAAVGIHSGLPCGAARDISSALMAMRQGSKPGLPAHERRRFVPVITFHGDRDVTVSEINSRNIVEAAAFTAGPLSTEAEGGQVAGGRRYTRAVSVNDRGEAVIEQWTIHGGGHAWSGGSPAGSYTDKLGPDASGEMMRFFLSHRLD